VHGVRVAAAAGCATIVLTNACGGLRPGLSVGDPVLIKDHLNLTWRTPLVGARFVDLTDLYTARLRALVRRGGIERPTEVRVGSLRLDLSDVPLPAGETHALRGIEDASLLVTRLLR